MEMLNKMDANAQRLDEMRGDMRIQRGEMQNMGLNLQAGQEAMRASMKEVKGKMADEIGTVRGGMTEPRGRAECVQPAMETGEFGTTSDATTIIGETCGVRHEGTTEKLKEVTETEKLTETQGETHIPRLE